MLSINNFEKIFRKLNMNIFLTGGTGFIGSNFVKLALSKSHNLIAIKEVKVIQKSF